jgi:hypothetical protein
VPFEDPSLPFLSGLGRTIAAALFQPAALFSGLPRGGLGRPLIYGLIVGCVAKLSSGLWLLLMRDALVDLGPPELQPYIPTEAAIRLRMLLSPVETLVMLLVFAGLLHIMLLVLGGGARGFSVTFRGLSYASTPFLFLALPFCGGLIGSVWSVVLVGVALAYGHRTKGWIAALAVLFTLMLSCCFWSGIQLAAGVAGSETAW